MTRSIYTVPQAAVALRCSGSHVRRLCDEKELAYFRVPSQPGTRPGPRRITRRALEELAARHGFVLHDAAEETPLARGA